MPRVLLLMASGAYAARDYLDAAAALGVEVVVGSDHRQALARFSEGTSVFVDLAVPDRGAGQVLSHLAHKAVDAVVGIDDESAEVAARVARVLGHPHNAPAAVRTARDKLAFRRVLKAAGIPGPRFRLLELDEAPDAGAVGYPAVIKPRSLSASRGVIRVDHPRALERACRRVGALLARIGDVVPEAHRRSALLESYLPGAEVAVEGLLRDGVLQVLALFDKPDPLVGPCFEESLLITPSRLAPSLQEDVVESVEAAARALGLRHGAVHAELRVHSGEPRLLELAPRAIGGLCGRSLRFAGDETLASMVLRNALGLPLPPSDRSRASGALMLPVPRGGRLAGVDGVARARAVPGIDDVVITVHAGDVLEPLPEGNAYPGFVFASGPTPAAVEAALREADRCIGLRFED